MRQRATASAPRTVRALLLVALAGQVALQALAPPVRAQAAALPPAPGITALRLAGLGDDIVTARLAMLALHASEGDAPLRTLDYGRVAGWLDVAQQLDPRSSQPLAAAVQVYGAVHDPARLRVMLDFAARAFDADPARRWPAMAQAALAARHRLHDLPLARHYARSIRLRAPDAPAWARELELFILRDMNELDSERAVTGALLSDGTVSDPNEVRFLERRLQELERGTGPQRGAPPAAGAR
ncbi:hypothetical protein IP91_00532 [Pseudoduganella lurida]|uniref:Uncharacterized protein n=1 Tax=Pseudoduganella lurida TaxID=1036180 RepID=A0A562RLI6_9BURK|nr:hypothetical protein [Pseudoduganella lurida]TWI69464.1 hypothetical protein IP91_00532 [Pseudoduganella lurida]